MSLDYMDSRLIRQVKSRIFRELTDTIQKHANYRDVVKAYHKFPYKERPMMGVVLKNVSANRMPLSADDYAATMASHLALARAEGKEGRILKWVWEDQQNLTKFMYHEDVSDQCAGTVEFGENRAFYIQNRPICSGQFNTEIADNFGQIEVTVNGSKIYAEFVDGEKGLVLLPICPVVGSEVLISYYYNNLTPPGRYYIELVDSTHFMIDPIYAIKDQKLIEKTTGTETEIEIGHTDLLPGFDYLYTQKYPNTSKIYLIRDTDYTITENGHVDFIAPLPVGTTLYITYRYVGSSLGPFDVPENEFQYNNTALPGVVLAFSSEKIVGDKNVVIVYPKREESAKVYSGHWRVSVELEVMSRDTVQLPELTDYIVDDIWSYKRTALIMEGYTIESFEPTGEFEEIYDENTGDQYYKNALSLVMMTEWKRFVPYLTEIVDYDASSYPVIKDREYFYNSQGKLLEVKVSPITTPFEVKYPEDGFVRYY